MRVRDLFLGVVTGVTGFIVVGVLVTEAASSYVAFSLLIGLPAGVLGGITLWAVTYLWLGDSAASARRRGMGLAAFGCIFLAVAVRGVVIADLRNSQALPLAGIASVLGAVGVALWLRRRERPLPKTDG